MILATFDFLALLVLLIWVALAVMSFWIWSATKAKASLMTLIGSALLALVMMVPAFGLRMELDILGVAGAALVVLGYYYTVKPTVDARIAALKAQAQAKSGSGPSTPA